MGESWARSGLIITCFNIYISHIKKFTSKINEEGEGLVCEKEERKRKIFALGEVDVEGASRGD